MEFMGIRLGPALKISGHAAQLRAYQRIQSMPPPQAQVTKVKRTRAKRKSRPKEEVIELEASAKDISNILPIQTTDTSEKSNTVPDSVSVIQEIESVVTDNKENTKNELEIVPESCVLDNSIDLTKDMSGIDEQKPKEETDTLMEHTNQESFLKTFSPKKEETGNILPLAINHDIENSSLAPLEDTSTTHSVNTPTAPLEQHEHTASARAEEKVTNDVIAGSFVMKMEEDTQDSNIVKIVECSSPNKHNQSDITNPPIQNGPLLDCNINASL